MFKYHSGGAGLFLLVLYLGLISSCAPSRFVRPLEKGEIAVTGSFGGPLFKNFGSPIPVPNATIAVGYGLNESWTGFAGVNLLSATFGNIHLDMGGSKLLIKPNGLRPGLTATPGANLVIGLNPNSGIRIWPTLDANAWWEYGERKHYAYAGFNAWAVLNGEGPNGADQPQHIMPGLQLGNTWSFNKIDISLEFKWSNIATPSQDGTVDWLAIQQKGATGIHIGLTKKFGK